MLMGSDRERHGGRHCSSPIKTALPAARVTSLMLNSPDGRPVMTILSDQVNRSIPLPINTHTLNIHRHTGIYTHHCVTVIISI